MNILRKIKDRKKVPGTICCPVCNDRFMFYSHHHDCISVIQQMFYRFTKARTIIENMVPDADVYIRPEKFRNCFLRRGRQFAKVGSVMEGI